MIYEKLMGIQGELVAPKNQYNSFGKYKYRSCEDILEAVKPLLSKYRVVLTLSDSIEQIDDRIYVRAVATLTDVDDGSSIVNTALAREDADKKGMDGSQITGTASSYARKYALNGLFVIDDNKDADTDEYKKRTTAKNTAKASNANDSENADSGASEIHAKIAAKVKELQSNGVPSKNISEAIKEVFGIANYKKANSVDAARILDRLENM